VLGLKPTAHGLAAARRTAGAVESQKVDRGAVSRQTLDGCTHQSVALADHWGGISRHYHHPKKPIRDKECLARQSLDELRQRRTDLDGAVLLDEMHTGDCDFGQVCPAADVVADTPGHDRAWVGVDE
jgi:hypothetical protein